jgi:opacity protein-like surface antigen
MKILLTVAAFFLVSRSFAQLEISTGIAVSKQNAVGVPIQVGYDFRVSDRFYTKTQVGFKYLYLFNGHVGATLKITSYELHQTFSFVLVGKRRYVLKPNLGVNYRFSHWKGEMQPPYNTLPDRAWVMGLRNGYFILTSYDNGYKEEYRVNNLGFSIQLQNQFRLNKKLWLHITPFIEPDYDRGQAIGGGYVGIILKAL